jgi:hypothetical protein
MSSVILDTLIAYKFIKIISTPWKDTEAYKLGIVDENGKILKKRGALTTAAEKSAYPSIFYTLCWNIKKILDRVPVINLKSRPGALIASVMLLRELCAKEISNPSIIDNLVKEELMNRGIHIDTLTESASEPKTLVAGQYIVRGREISLDSDLLPIDECYGHPVYKAGGMYFIFSEARKKVDEDAPVNSVGSGNIAGVSPGQEPPGPKGGFEALKKLRRKKATPSQIDPNLDLGRQR